jgi:hypothetical protein
MASTEDNDMGEEVAVMEEPAVRSNVKRLHSSHDSGMESEYEFDATHFNLDGTKSRRSLYNLYFIV